MGRDFAPGRDNQPHGFESVRLHYRGRACIVKLASKRPKVDHFSRTRMMHGHFPLPLLLRVNALLAPAIVGCRNRLEVDRDDVRGRDELSRILFASRSETGADVVRRLRHLHRHSGKLHGQLEAGLRSIGLLNDGSQLSLMVSFLCCGRGGALIAR